jgi:hypothetical protein
MGDITKATWPSRIINEGHSFPLTVHARDEATFRRLDALLNSTHETHTPYSGFSQFIAETGIWCREIEEYVEQYREQWERPPSEKQVKKYIREYGEDWEDFVELEEPELPIQPYCDLGALFRGRQLPIEKSRSLAREFGVDLMRFFVREWSAPDYATFLKDGHRDRKRFDQLERFGLASIIGPVQRKKKTGVEVRFAIPPFGLEIGEISRWLDYCETRAFLLAHTYRMSRPIREDSAILNILVGYEVSTVGDGCVCRHCRQFDGKKYPVDQVPRPPFHVGCRCSLLAVMKND